MFPAGPETPEGIASTAMLGEIVRRASGTDYPAYLHAHVLTPLGMTATAFEPLEPALAARRAVASGMVVY